MANTSRFRGRESFILVIAAAALLAACVISGWKVRQRETAVASQPDLRQSTIYPRLVSYASLSAMEGEECAWAPASATSALATAFLQGQSSGRASAPAPRDVTRSSDLSGRKPVRMIRDPYAAFSAVAVDHQNNEVVMTDENLFQVLVYDRLANTPPTASMTEPKRVLGGDKTEIEFQCSLYIDPKTGDIYAANNDTVDTLVIFSRKAKGNVPPDRELHTPHATFGIAVDEEREEMFFTIQYDDAIVVYPKYAQKNDPPIRLLQGDRTLLADPHGIALDTKHDLMFVTNYGATQSKRERQKATNPNWPLSPVVPGSGRFYPPSITVYRTDAIGNTPPVRVIQGPKTRLNWATGISLDSDRNELYVANDMGNEVLVFDTSAEGDVAPKRVLRGPKTLLKNPTAVFVDLKNDELWVTNFGNHSAAVYKRAAEGDTPPLRVIRGGPAKAPSPMMGNPHPVAYDSKRDQILVPN